MVRKILIIDFKSVTIYLENMIGIQYYLTKLFRFLDKKAVFDRYCLRLSIEL